MRQAEARFKRFQPLLQSLFPSELEKTYGLIESPLIKTPALQNSIGLGPEFGRLWVKTDHTLPVAGSIKARGGFHEVLEHVERLGRRLGLISGEDMSGLIGPDAKKVFAGYEVAVGSTGNLGISIGLIASAFGFRSTVHMSSDAKMWKKSLLAENGVQIIEHSGDYASAVEAGRVTASKDERTYFVDDENSKSLFLGYSVAALRLRHQLAHEGVIVDETHPLFVYIPCGVGGAPGGIAFGLNLIFGLNVHCFFAEPTASPCFLVAMQGQDSPPKSVYEFGLDNITEADGLAVPRASENAVNLMRNTLSGIFTVPDEMLFRNLFQLARTEHLKVEPSAASAVGGPTWVTNSECGEKYIDSHGLQSHIQNANHIIWTTGGGLLPQAEYRKLWERGASIHAFG